MTKHATAHTDLRSINARLRLGLVEIEELVVFSALKPRH
jgi:hypothetical protein